jgi:1-phosphofructokinase family hexose kinase
MILTFTPNPAVDKTVFVDAIALGEKHRSQRVTCIPGGKGCNVARAAKALGHEAKAMIIAGGPTGQHVVDMIEQEDGLPCVPFWVEGLTRTITTVLEDHPHRQTVFFEPGPVPTGDEIEQLIDAYRAAVAGATVATFNGAVQDPSLRPLYRRLIAVARDAGARCILDTYGAELAMALESAPYAVKPNAVEAEGLVGFALDTPDAQWRAVRFFHERGVEMVVLSLGEAGALFSTRDAQFHATPPPIEEVNPVGSGDSLVAGIAVGLAEGWTLEHTARIAIAAGTANAMSWDIGHFDRALVEHLAEQVTFTGA